MTNWELHDGTAQIGPLDENHVVRMINAGLPVNTMVRQVGTEEWRTLRSHAPFAIALEGQMAVRETAAQVAPITGVGRSASPTLPTAAKGLSVPFLVGGALALIVVLAMVIGVSRSSHEQASTSSRTNGTLTTTPSGAPTQGRPIQQEPSNPLDVVMTKKTMADAWKVSAPLMRDRFNDSSPGTFLFALWSLEHLGWKDVAVAAGETTHAKAQKDIDAERGKRLCVGGALIEIAAHKQPYGTLYTGLLMNDSMNLYHFNAVKSTGDLVAASSARFCGVVTGAYDYTNSAGGSGHAIDMVGIFDLPANRN